MKKLITVCVLFAVLAVVVGWHLEELSAKAQTEHRWASELAECKWEGSSTFSCGRSLNISYVLYDCTQPAPPKDTRTQAEKEADAKSGIVWAPWLQQPTCKMAVLDWCIEHGETRVVKENSVKEQPR